MSQRMSIEQFVSMARSMPLDKLASLPLETLPETIPPELIRNSPQPLRGVLEKLAFDLNVRELREQQALEQQFGDQVSQALDKSRGHEADIAIARLRQKIADITPAVEKWRAGKMTNYAMSQTIYGLREIIAEVHAERARMAKAELIISECLANNPGNPFEGKLREALERIKRFSGKLDAALGEYHALQLEVAAADMNDKRRQINESDLKKKDLLEELEALESQLKRPASMFSRLLPWRAQKHEENIKQRISDLHQRIMSEEWVMAESQLTRWLDALVDASLYTNSTATQQMLRQARLNLFFLLNAYCEQQEAAARQVARNPFVQVDPKKAIEYMLMSERFILDYFAKKRAEIIQWLGNAADNRLRALEHLEVDLISELKRNMR